ncbi:MAG: HEAT repeat domain-containing protein, partial [Thermoanaerobaculia bacterium]
MRKLVPLALLLAIACTTATPPAPTTPAAAEDAGPYGMTVEEEAQILAMEDRRAFDPALVSAWMQHANALHRRRLALALGRIGPHTFADTDNDGELDATEHPAGFLELIALAKDSDRSVRETVAFALGEVGDSNASDTLFALSADNDAAVAGEAIEALSKLATNVNWRVANQARYLWFTNAQWPEGLRARAARFLFRFDTDQASETAVRLLSDSSSAVRQEAAYALSRRPFARAARQLELLMTDANVLTRAYAIAGIGRVAETASLPGVIAALG